MAREIDPEPIIRDIQAVLTPDLLKPKYRKNAHLHPHWGHCYAASEALWHLLGADKSSWTSYQMRVKGDSHWFLARVAPGGKLEVLDPTAGQFTAFGITPKYAKGRGRGFPGTRHNAQGRLVPGKPASEIILRVDALRRARAAGALPRAKNPLPWLAWVIPIW